MLGVPLSFTLYRYPDADPIVSPEVRTVNYFNSHYGFPADLPNVTFSIVSTFRAQGTFGADNPIKIHAVINGVRMQAGFNSSTLLAYYYAVVYTDGYPPKPNDSASVSLGRLPLDDLRNGTFVADGTLEWHEGGGTWVSLLPSISLIRNIGADRALMAQGPPTTTIGPVKETRDWQSDELHTRIEIMSLFFIPLLAYGGFVILFSRRAERPQDSGDDGDTEP